MPPAARTSASAAKAPSSVDWNRGRASALPTASSIVTTSEIETPRSIDQIAARAGAAIADGSPFVRSTIVR